MSSVLGLSYEPRQTIGLGFFYGSNGRDCTSIFQTVLAAVREHSEQISKDNIFPSPTYTLPKAIFVLGVGAYYINDGQDGPDKHLTIKACSASNTAAALFLAEVCRHIATDSPYMPPQFPSAEFPRYLDEKLAESATLQWEN
ncbi:hypothetical protein ATO7_14378 [Oceanococcus atlanticus]|uniref:Uncharacterized protein n=1 Tax=Oceanococcus atlanticus TaxID=1317117 RepID=A0A1Y1SAK1_9GAMM|nr:hypothetical protein [Oceanococcus atlanticus]ORE85416.1 hypothetical protein ATO7_14378 [Oceanococcus atlanticus]